MRQYKGLDLACAAVERLNGRVQLIIGGPHQCGFRCGAVLADDEAMPGGVLIDRELTDQEFADLTAASDAILLPYRAITGSAALLAALGLGRASSTSDIPIFPGDPRRRTRRGRDRVGLGPAAWADGILRYLERPAAARSRAALRLAERYSWDRCVEPLVDALGIPPMEAGRRAGAHGGRSFLTVEDCGSRVSVAIGSVETAMTTIAVLLESISRRISECVPARQMEHEISPRADLAQTPEPWQGDRSGRAADHSYRYTRRARPSRTSLA